MRAGCCESVMSAKALRTCVEFFRREATVSDRAPISAASSPFELARGETKVSVPARRPSRKHVSVSTRVEEIQIRAVARQRHELIGNGLKTLLVRGNRWCSGRHLRGKRSRSCANLRAAAWINSGVFAGGGDGTLSTC